MISRKNVFITSPAGCGKTAIIKKFYNEYKNDRKIVVTSTTGTSAILIGGVTLHSYLGIGLGQASTKDGASAIAYENALKFLENYGITTEWAVKEKNKLDFSYFLNLFINYLNIN
jgi:ATP/maltotriose-dependent transcriptional regulator MalT